MKSLLGASSILAFTSSDPHSPHGDTAIFISILLKMKSRIRDFLEHVQVYAVINGSQDFGWSGTDRSSRSPLFIMTHY